MKQKSFPKRGTPARKLLELLSDGRAHDRNEIAQLIGEDMRSPLQDLRGKKYRYWYIHNVRIKGERQTFLKLDPRHLSGDEQLDALARAEREVLYLLGSYSHAKSAYLRLTKLSRELVIAQTRLFELYPEAANSPQFRQKKDQSEE
ncbi:hypothetical protein DRW07_05280 [Alteromonas sediminis]|uniref:Uncharacterized protein n=1 Tax=Alteromonas sediminis TaxID=2259342 RepID=A0A3N5Y040_9ALTE|nr:hypothetical protein [Alteromonas sediminis]RPJ66957.1 hypothetical protein DRW07_05280 [Alteromonas sediminis]